MKRDQMILPRGLACPRCQFGWPTKFTLNADLIQEALNALHTSNKKIHDKLVDALNRDQE